MLRLCVNVHYLVVMCCLVCHVTGGMNSCQDIDPNACRAMASQNPDMCSDPTLSISVCPKFCNNCPLVCYSCNNTDADIRYCNMITCASGEVCLLRTSISAETSTSMYVMSCGLKTNCSPVFQRHLVSGDGEQNTYQEGAYKMNSFTVQCCDSDLCNLPTIRASIKPQQHGTRKSSSTAKTPTSGQSVATTTPATSQSVTTKTTPATSQSVTTTTTPATSQSVITTTTTPATSQSVTTTTTPATSQSVTTTTAPATRPSLTTIFTPARTTVTSPSVTTTTTTTTPAASPSVTTTATTTTTPTTSPSVTTTTTTTTPTTSPSVTTTTTTTTTTKPTSSTLTTSPSTNPPVLAITSQLISPSAILSTTLSSIESLPVTATIHPTTSPSVLATSTSTNSLLKNTSPPMIQRVPITSTPPTSSLKIESSTSIPSPTTYAVTMSTVPFSSTSSATNEINTTSQSDNKVVTTSPQTTEKQSTTAACPVATEQSGSCDRDVIFMVEIPSYPEEVPKLQNFMFKVINAMKIGMNSSRIAIGTFSGYHGSTIIELDRGIDKLPVLQSITFLRGPPSSEASIFSAVRYILDNFRSGNRAEIDDVIIIMSKGHLIDYNFHNKYGIPKQMISNFHKLYSNVNILAYDHAYKEQLLSIATNDCHYKYHNWVRNDTKLLTWLSRMICV